MLDWQFLEIDTFTQKKVAMFFAENLNGHVNKLTLVNMRGQIILEFNNVSKETLQNGMQFNNIATGAYVVCVTIEQNKVLTKKIIVN